MALTLSTNSNHPWHFYIKEHVQFIHVRHITLLINKQTYKNTKLELDLNSAEYPSQNHQIQEIISQS